MWALNCKIRSWTVPPNQGIYFPNMSIPTEYGMSKTVWLLHADFPNRLPQGRSEKPYCRTWQGEISENHIETIWMPSISVLACFGSIWDLRPAYNRVALCRKGGCRKTCYRQMQRVWAATENQPYRAKQTEYWKNWVQNMQWTISINSHTNAFSLFSYVHPAFHCNTVCRANLFAFSASYAFVLCNLCKTSFMYLYCP